MAAAVLWPTVVPEKAPVPLFAKKKAVTPADAKVTAKAVLEAATPEYLNGTVAAIPDGDTVHIKSGEALHRIRLHGVDCPESKQPFGPEARAFTAKLVNGKAVTVRVREMDQYKRFVGEVFIDGYSLNRELARNGLAWWYKTYAAGDLDLKRLVDAARSEERGLWADPDPTPPWDFRKMKD